MEHAFAAMQELEAGVVANPDEGRRVGHYWLRRAALAPTRTLAREIERTIADVKAFATQVHTGKIVGSSGPFRHLLVVGIGGSALGPQFAAGALGHPTDDKLTVSFLDNTDPDGMDRVLARLEKDLGQLLVVVISKSGSTPETRNGMLEVEAAYGRAGLAFARHAVAITQFSKQESALYAKATKERWLALFPMWDWVGGRTSETSAVGLLPLALQGVDIDGLLAGARACDDLTRLPKISENPAALVALAWYHCGAGRGAKDMVVLPYKDRLELFAKYLQQLIMESLGKELDLQGRLVNQGLAVYGNKGSTDQHAYVQQLRDGLNNFFVLFVQVLKSRAAGALAQFEVEAGATSGDFLHGFLVGTGDALHANGRESITLTVDEVSPFSVGVLIALFERAVGLYAALIGINAYHQPGVQAGKVAAKKVLDLQRRIVAKLRAKPARALSAPALAEALGDADPILTFRVCHHLAANGRSVRQRGHGPQATFSYGAAPKPK